MTRRGIAALAILILLLALALSTGARTIYFALFFVTLFVLLCAVSVLLPAHSSRCDPEVTGVRIARKSPQRLTLRIYARNLLPLMVHFRVEVPDGLCKLPAPNFSMILKPGKGVREIPIDLPCEHRGFWHVGIGPVSLVDLFGLFSYRLPAKKVTPGYYDITVCPRLFETEDTAEAVSAEADSSRSDDRPVDTGDSYAGVRDYIAGDSMRRIHWIHTARTRELQTRQYDTNTERYGMLLIDTAVNRTSSAENDDPEERRLSYADLAGEVASMMARYYLSQGLTMRVTMIGTTEERRLASDVSAFAEIYDLMTFSDFGYEEGGCPIPSSLSEEAVALRVFCIVTARPDASLQKLLDELTLRKCQVVCFLPDTAECRAFEAASVTGARILRVADLGEMLAGKEDAV